MQNCVIRAIVFFLKQLVTSAQLKQKQIHVQNNYIYLFTDSSRWTQSLGLYGGTSTIQQHKVSFTAVSAYTSV